MSQLPPPEGGGLNGNIQRIELIRDLKLMFKKTLTVKLKNTLRDTPLVSNPVSSVLNKDESLSVQDKVLVVNTPEVDQPQQTEGQNLRVSDRLSVFLFKQKERSYVVARIRLLLLYNSSLIYFKNFNNKIISLCLIQYLIFSPA